MDGDLPAIRRHQEDLDDALDHEARLRRRAEEQRGAGGRFDPSRTGEQALALRRRELPEEAQLSRCVDLFLERDLGHLPERSGSGASSTMRC